MIDQAISFKQEVIAASNVEIPADGRCPVCPYCRKQDMLLRGVCGVPHTETVVNGEVVSKETDWDYEDAYQIYSFACMNCTIRFIIKSDEEVKLATALQAVQATSGQSRVC